MSKDASDSEVVLFPLLSLFRFKGAGFKDSLSVLKEDFNLFLGLIEFLATEMGETNPFLEKLQGFFQVQISVLEFGNHTFQATQSLFELLFCYGISFSHRNSPRRSVLYNDSPNRQPTNCLKGSGIDSQTSPFQDRFAPTGANHTATVNGLLRRNIQSVLLAANSSSFGNEFCLLT